MTQYRAKIELDFIIQDWDRAREVALEFVKTQQGMASANPDETMDQLAMRVVGNDKLVADMLAVATIVRGAQEFAAADVGNFKWSLAETDESGNAAVDEPSQLQRTWIIAQALASNGGSSATQLLPNDGVQLSVNGTTAEGDRWFIVQRVQLIEAKTEKLSSGLEPPTAPA